MNRMGLGGIGLLAALAGFSDPALGLPEEQEKRPVARVYVVRVLDAETWELVVESGETFAYRRFAEQHPLFARLDETIKNQSDEPKDVLIQIVQVDNDGSRGNPLVCSSDLVTLDPLTDEERNEIKFEQLNQLRPGLGDLARKATQAALEFAERQDSDTGRDPVIGTEHPDNDGDGHCDICGVTVDNSLPDDESARRYFEQIDTERADCLGVGDVVTPDEPRVTYAGPSDDDLVPAF